MRLKRVLIAVLSLTAALAVGVALVVRDGGEGTESRRDGRTGSEGENGGRGPSSIQSVDAEAFERALKAAQPGTVIRLREGRYPRLRIKGVDVERPVRVVGTPKTTVAGIAIEQSRNVVFEGFSVAPEAGEEARVSVRGSSGITFSHVRFNGRSESEGVWMKIDRDSSRVRVVESEFADCSAGRPCVQPGGTEITVRGNIFHDCFDCDMIRAGGSSVTIAGNRFERALRGDCGGEGSRCNHNDLIQIMGGGPWTIVGNRFGEIEGGAAQIYINAGRKNVSNPIHDVRIVSNLFSGTMLHAIRVGGGGSIVGPARGVSIVNNTILAGRASSIRIADSYGELAPEERPLVANNILGVSKPALCDVVRSEANLIVDGPTCSASDRAGSPALDAEGRPTADSTLVVDAAEPAFAPPTDLLGRPRVGAPDIGAVEAVPAS